MTNSARPCLKWAGGKTQLLDQIAARLPAELRAGKLARYVEPFVGSGAVFFFVAENFPTREYFLSDLNPELVLVYRVIRANVDALIAALTKIERKYFKLAPDAQKKFFYDTRAKFNATRAHLDCDNFQPEWIARAAQIIFLNRTCYNGLFRVNARGGFNVPFGSYKNPRICDAENLRAVARLLQRATIEQGDFAACARVVDRDTFVYFDPPYRPLSATASFTAYARAEFDDAAQRRLAEFYRALDARGAKLMLSNSDPKNVNPDDDFFEQLYAGFRITRVSAARMINSVASKRGAINELIVTNY
ncbi:MAG: DNA adenine methylase [Chloroflexi bacterium]|nr:DNA adenine methylase [Chloroflexota bacterium]